MSQTSNKANTDMSASSSLKDQGFSEESQGLNFPAKKDAFAPTEQELDKVYLHLDYRIIPALWCIFFLTEFGACAYGNTLTMNYKEHHSLEESLDLDTRTLSTANALSTVAFIIFDLPMNLAMTKLSPKVWLCRIVIGVGICYACFAALRNASGLLAIAFMTGFAGAGSWPGLTYYVSLWYPEHRTAKRIGYYFTAGQISASAAGLVAAGFQRMDMVNGLYGWKWLYLIYGCITILLGILLIWWLPDRPTHLCEQLQQRRHHIFPNKIHQLFTATQPLSSVECEMHAFDMRKRYKQMKWTFMDLLRVFLDLRTWALILMYFGVVGTGVGLATFATTLIKVNNPKLSEVDISLLYAPIWLFDLAAILLITPLADRFKDKRPLFFSGGRVIIIVGLMVTTYTKGPWTRWGGLLICGFGLGPTVPICMTLASEIMTKVYGDVGCAAAAALVSGLGNLGSVTSTYALYTGWPSDEKNLYRNSNMILVLICGTSIVACFALTIMRKFMSEEPYVKQQKLRNTENKDEESL